MLVTTDDAKKLKAAGRHKARGVVRVSQALEHRVHKAKANAAVANGKEICDPVREGGRHAHGRVVVLAHALDGNVREDEVDAKDALVNVLDDVEG